MQLTIPHAVAETIAPAPTDAQTKHAVPAPEINRPMSDVINPRTPGVVVFFLFALPESDMALNPIPMQRFRHRTEDRIQAIRLQWSSCCRSYCPCLNRPDLDLHLQVQSLFCFHRFPYPRTPYAHKSQSTAAAETVVRSVNGTPIFIHFPKFIG